MAVKQRDKTREELIQNIKDCGQSLIDNAEKIVTDYKYNTGVRIICNPNYNNDGVPYIVVEQEFCPEKFIERHINK